MNLVFVGVSNPAISIRRVAGRVEEGGHSVPQESIVRRYERSMGNLAAAVRLSHRALIIDNSRNSQRLMLSMNNGEIAHERLNLPKWVKSALSQELQRKTGLSL